MNIFFFYYLLSYNIIKPSNEQPLPGGFLLRHRPHVHDDPSVQHLWRADCRVPADGALRRLLHLHHGPDCL